mmetsp:Transcript_30866/g.59586  ORF Transcript_30866/g.59586 Transcript_30866/m.59586 type:complete len:225 (+) Transcript_30866:775-1449(+)
MISWFVRFGMSTCKAHIACSCSDSHSRCSSMALTMAWIPRNEAILVLLDALLEPRLCKTMQPCSCTSTFASWFVIAVMVAPTPPAAVNFGCCSWISESRNKNLQPCVCMLAEALYCFITPTAIAMGSIPSACDTSSTLALVAAASTVFPTPSARTLRPRSRTISLSGLSFIAVATSCGFIAGNLSNNCSMFTVETLTNILLWYGYGGSISTMPRTAALEQCTIA